MPNFSITPNAERDFMDLTADDRRNVADALLRPTKLNMQKVAGVNDLVRIRLGSLRIAVKRLHSELVILRIASKTSIGQFFDEYRHNAVARRADRRVPLTESAVGRFADGQTPAGMLESIEHRMEAGLTNLHRESQGLHEQVRELRRSIEGLEMSSIEAETSQDGFLNGVRDDFLSVLQLVEERVVRLESRRAESLWDRVRSTLTAILPAWLVSLVSQSQRG